MTMLHMDNWRLKLTWMTKVGWKKNINSNENGQSGQHYYNYFKMKEKPLKNDSTLYKKSKTGIDKISFQWFGFFSMLLSKKSQCII